MKKALFTIITILILAALGFGGYYYFINKKPVAAPTGTQTNHFSPFTTTPSPSGGSNQTQQPTQNNNAASTSQATQTPVKLPALRLLSSTPVGGYAASTTASTTVVRWVDRGRGNIYEAKGDTALITTLSNTLVPRIYESLWNKNLTAFIGLMLQDNSDTVSAVYAELKLASTTTSASSTSQVSAPGEKTPYELKGKNIKDSFLAYAVSPKRDRVFTLILENGKGVGYVSNIDGSKNVRIFETPATQFNAEWPEENTISLTTKGAAGQGGYLYFIDPKTGAWKKIIGPVDGLSTKTSGDAKRVLFSSTKGGSIDTEILTVASNAVTDATVQTLADKCVWGNFYKDIVYCAVPIIQIAGTFPDDWYKGTVSFSDKIWQINGSTGELHLVASLLELAKSSIDAFNPSLDPHDSYLFFMNKNDLSLWSLDLVSVK